MDTIREILAIIQKLGSDPVFMLALQVAGAMLSTMAIVQGLKWLLKSFWPFEGLHKLLTLSIFIAAVAVGYHVGDYFIDSHRWAWAIGVLNPVVYFALVQYAKVKNRIILLSVLKMRPVIQKKGEWTVDETQTFGIRK